ncbi:MAG: PD-(D/E)XK nuclease family protein, partial [Rhodospirillaceae bacterium]
MNGNPDLSEVSAVEGALTDLIMNCPELPKLEAQLAQFNIFRVLRADRNELRHSNMLAWLFRPDEQHSFGDLFL